MTVRITVSLPADLHAQLVRLSEASHVSASATVRMVLSDVLPRMTRVMDYLGTSPEVSADQVAAVDAWAADLKRLTDSAPPILGPFVNDIGGSEGASE